MIVYGDRPARALGQTFHLMWNCFPPAADTWQTKEKYAWATQRAGECWDTWLGRVCVSTGQAECGRWLDAFDYSLIATGIEEQRSGMTAERRRVEQEEIEALQREARRTDLTAEEWAEIEAAMFEAQLGDPRTAATIWGGGEDPLGLGIDIGEGIGKFEEAGKALGRLALWGGIAVASILALVIGGKVYAARRALKRKRAA